MPRWGRKRRAQEEEERFELRSDDDSYVEDVPADPAGYASEEASEERLEPPQEQTLEDAPSAPEDGTAAGESEEWPDWAYEERRSRRRKGRRSKRGGGRRGSDAVAKAEVDPLFDQSRSDPGEEVHDEVVSDVRASEADDPFESSRDDPEPLQDEKARSDESPGPALYDALDPSNDEVATPANHDTSELAFDEPSVAADEPVQAVSDESAAPLDHDVPELAFDEPPHRGADQAGELAPDDASETGGDVAGTDSLDIWTSSEQDGSVPPVWSPEEEQRLREAEPVSEQDVGTPEAGVGDPSREVHPTAAAGDPVPIDEPPAAREFDSEAPFDAASMEFHGPVIEPIEPAHNDLEEYDPPRLDRMPSGWSDERLEARAEASSPGDHAEVFRGDADESYEDRYDEYEEDDDGYEHDRDRRSYQPVAGDVLPGGLGPRRAALHERRRKRRRAAAAVLAAALAVGVVGVSVLGGDDDGDDGERDRSGVPVATGDDSVETMLLFGTKEDAAENGAVWLTLLSIDRKDKTGSVVYMPSHIAVEVPGRGLLPLGESYGTEDIPLLLVSSESLLGIEIDSYLELSDRDARVLFDALGGLTVDVPAEVTVPAGGGRARLLFPEGEQQLDGGALEDLLYVKGIDGDDVELGSRHLAFWDALFETFAERTEELEAAIVDSSAVLAESERSAEENADFIGDLASLPEQSVVFNSLPVEEAAVGQEELYSVNDEELRAFVRDTIGARITLGDEIRVQILNGNGVPGIGAEVAEKLGAEDYRVILAGNARRLNYKKTLIIAYDRSTEGIERAERARELLGVGEVQVSAQDQGIVDLTIVVGKDFLGRT